MSSSRCAVRFLFSVAVDMRASLLDRSFSTIVPPSSPCVKCIFDIIDMRMTHLENVDLNLLPPLAALLEERHVTRAAERSGLSQPAMSRAFARLRQVLDD